MIITIARHTFRVSYLVTGLILILLALFTVTARVGLPLLATHKSNIESRISDYLRNPVEIGELSLRWQGFGPRLQASNVSVIESADRVVTLDEILVDVNLAKSLLRGIPIINELSLVGATLAIETDNDGQVRIHGMTPAGDVDGSAPVADTQGGGVDVAAWLFNARKVALVDTELTLINPDKDQQLVINSLDILAENEGRKHQLRVDATLPESLGGSLTAGIDLFGESDKLAESDGDVYLAADFVNIQGVTDILRLSGLLPAELPDGDAGSTLQATASLEFWGQWKDGELVSARGPLTLSDVIDTASNERLLDSASAQLSVSRTDISVDLLATDVQASYGSTDISLEKILLSKGRMTHPNDSASASSLVDRVTRSLGGLMDDSSPWQLSASARELPADMLARLAGIGLLSKKPELANSVLSSVASGQIENLQLVVSDAMASPSISVSADVADIAITGDGNVPTVGPLRGKLAMEESIGQLTISADRMPLRWPGFSDESLNVDTLNALVDIDMSDRQRMYVNADVQLSDDGIETSTRMKATMLTGARPHLDVQSRFSADDIAALKQWLPRKKLSAGATRWIDRAIESGEATDGSLLFFGNVADFPFDNGDGVFRATVQINDGTLAFLPSWPSATDINGTLELNGLSITGVAQNSTLGKFNVSKTRVAINNLAAPVLEFAGTASGVYQDIVEFGINGPLRRILRPAIGDMSGTGSAEMDLALAYPLFRKPAEDATGARARLWQPFSIDGSLFLQNNDVTFARAGLTLTDANGAVGFDRHGIAINTLQGQILDHDVRITGGTDGLGDSATTTINISGAMEANDLLAHHKITLDQFVRGTSQWKITVAAPHSAERIARDGVTLAISSDLAGTELLLPAPFNKSSGTTRDFMLTAAFRDDSGDQRWEVFYGDELRTNVRMINSDMYSLLVELGNNPQSLDRSALLNERGIRIQGDVPQLAADGWVQTVSKYIDSLPDGQGEPQLILPVSGTITTDSLVLGNTNFGNASLRANSDRAYINFAVANQAVKGNLRYPRAHWQKDTALRSRIDVLDWLVIDALSAEDSNPDAWRTESSQELDPPIITAYRGKNIDVKKGDIQIKDLVLRAQPNVSGLDVTTLGFAYDTTRLVGQGHWHLRDPQGVNANLSGKHSTQLNLVLQSDDFGTGLSDIGLNDVLNGGQGSIEIKLDWPGPIYKPQVAELDGKIRIDMQSGSIVPLEPGAGRMVGLFAFQALPRRLNLDFKDLTDVGLAFRSISGNIDINSGIAQVPLLQLTGPIGVVDIIGSSNLITQQFDQEVTVLPRVSAALPVIGAISGGASAGIGALVAAGFLKALGVDFDRIGLRAYSLTGAWAAPQFTPLPD